MAAMIQIRLVRAYASKEPGTIMRVDAAVAHDLICDGVARLYPDSETADARPKLRPDEGTDDLMACEGLRVLDEFLANWQCKYGVHLHSSFPGGGKDSPCSEGRPTESEKGEQSR